MNTQSPLIIVLGASGRGKSTAIRNLDPDSTMIFNVENKPLPFKNAKEFTKESSPKTPASLIALIEQTKFRDDIKVNVIDSFSAFTDALMSEARRTKKGYDVFNYYNEVIYQLFQSIKDSGKITFLIGHDEVLTTGDGQTIKSLKVKGKEWEGVSEKEAVMVLYAVMQRSDDNINQYYFQTQTDGITPAKSPMGMFEDFLIPNDYQYVVDKMNEYWQDNKEEEQVEEAEVTESKPQYYEDVENAKTVEELTQLWTQTYRDLQSNKEFKEIVVKKKIELLKEKEEVKKN